ncbi:major facilitator superfamily domain-containing protein [Tuber indicum]|nr:major facilitator superfamily domain-containing protein [Tuber indicum]
MAFLDRVNIANAVIFGLKEELKLSGLEYNTCLTIFFAPYILLEIPSNVLMKKLRPRVWLPICMFMFGLVTTMQGFVHNYTGILTTRFLLGVFESGMFPGSFYLISMWYKREEAQKRCTFFFSSTVFAGAFGGLLASAIGLMDGKGGYRGWRWIFILEGVLTCVISLLFYFIITDFPEGATFLTDAEREFVRDRLREDVGDPVQEAKLTPKVALGVFKDFKIFIGGFMYFGIVVPAYGYAYFAPTIIRQFGYSPIQTQLRSVPPWAVAFVFAMTIATISDSVRHRFLFTVFPLCISMAGFIILLTVHNNIHVQYFALFLAAMGMYTAMPVVVCWFNTNLGGHHRRAVGTAWQIGFGNVGGVISTYSFLSKDAPRFTKGYSIGLAFMCFSVLSCIAYFLAVSRENRKRVQGIDKYSGATEEEKKSLGDLSPDYRYFL